MGSAQGLAPTQKINLQITIEEIDNGYLLSWWDESGYHRTYREEMNQIGEFIKTLNK